MSSASKAAASWAVAAGVAAVEALKDQAGLCRWNYAIRSLHQHARNSAKSAKVRKLSSPGAVEHAKLGVADATRRAAREAEKADNVMNLVCWGPR